MRTTGFMPSFAPSKPDLQVGRVPRQLVAGELRARPEGRAYWRSPSPLLVHIHALVGGLDQGHDVAGFRRYLDAPDAERHAGRQAGELWGRGEGLLQLLGAADRF